MAAKTLAVDLKVTYIRTHKVMFYRRNIALVQLYYDRLNSISYTETPAYTIAQLSAEFGGLMGIILGPSVITFVEFFYCLVGLIVHALTKGKVSIM